MVYRSHDRSEWLHRGRRLSHDKKEEHTGEIVGHDAKPSIRRFRMPDVDKAFPEAGNLGDPGHFEDPHKDMRGVI